MRKYLDAIGVGIATLLVSSVLLVARIAILRRARFFMRCSSLCRAACFIEIWSKITGDKPVDTDSLQYQEITRVIDYYLLKPFISREPISVFERMMLRYNFSYAQIVVREKAKGKEKSHHRYVLKHRLARIIKNYVNIENYISMLATNELTKIETTFKENPSSPYWKAKVVTSKLPEPLRRNQKPAILRRYLKTTVRRAKRDLAIKNYLKVDFTPSDVTALVTLSGTLLLLLGYLRVAAVNWYLGVPYERYFALSDYLASSISAVDKYLLSAVITVLFAFFFIARVNSYSLQGNLPEYRSFGERLNNWAYHFTAILAALGSIALFVSARRIDSLMLFIVCLYVGIPMIGIMSTRFFVHPIKAFLFLGLVFVAFVNGVTGVIRELNQISDFKEGPPIRILKFSNAEYFEPEWRVLAITSGFVILRRQKDGMIQVLAKSELKSVDDIPVPLTVSPTS